MNSNIDFRSRDEESKGREQDDNAGQFLRIGDIIIEEKGEESEIVLVDDQQN